MAAMPECTGCRQEGSGFEKSRAPEGARFCVLILNIFVTFQIQPPNKISKPDLKMQAFYIWSMKFYQALNSYIFFLYRTRMEFRMQSMATPVSANTAIHMDAKPQRPRIITQILTASAKTTFCQEIRLVARAIARA